MPYEAVTILGADLPCILRPEDGPATIGRDADCRIRLDDATVSRQHGRITCGPDGWTIEDLGTPNGIQRNGKRCLGACPIVPGDDLRIGRRTLVVGLASLPIGRMHDRTRTIAVPVEGRGLEGRCDDVHALLRTLVMSEQTGILNIGGDGAATIALRKGIPVNALRNGKVGLAALFEVMQGRNYTGFNFVPGDTKLPGSEIVADTQDLLMALFGGQAMGVDELAKAEGVQRRMFGQMPRVPGWELATHWHGLARVSGDFHAAGPMADGRLLVVVGDVTGHGVQAAILIGGLLRSLRTIRRHERSPARVLVRLGEELTTEAAPGQFATAIALAIDPSSGRSEVVLAGHHPLLLRLADGSVRPVGEPGPMLGMLPSGRLRERLTTTPLQIGSGDAVLLCTDGAIEGRSPGSDILGEAGLANLFAGITGDGPAALAGLERAIRAHAPVPTDDLTLLLVRRLVAPVQATPGGGVRRTTSVELRHRLNRPLPANSQAEPPVVLAGNLPVRSTEGSSADLTLDEVIGAGGGGTVLAGIQHGLERPVAVKCLPAGAPEVRTAAMIAEARATARLDHPNIVPVYDLAEDGDGGLLYTMKRMDGQTWFDRMAMLDRDENLEVLLKVCDAVAFAHQRGVVHRDLKPSNIMVGDLGEVLVLDWGLAVTVAGADPALSAVLGPAVPGLAQGSPAYMAPEQALGAAHLIGPATDVYLLGGVLLEMLTGCTPHDGVDSAECMQAASENRLAPTPDSLVAEPLLAIAHACLESEPARRPADASVLRQMLRDHLRHRESLRLCDRAAAITANAGSHLDHARVVTLYEQAIEAWQHNLRAHEGLVAARAAWAAESIRRGDLDLAESQLSAAEPSHRPLLAELAKSRSERAAQIAAQSRVRAMEEKLARDTARSWVAVPDIALDGPGWEVSGTWTRVEGGMMLSGPYPRMLRLHRPVRSDLRISLSFTLPDPEVNDLTLFFCCPPGDPGPSLQAGYQLKIGGYSNTINLLIRAGARLFAGPDSPLKTGHRHRLVVELVDGLIAVRFDDRLICAERDEHPLGAENMDRIGLMNWASRAIIHEFMVERLGQPASAPIATLAKRHADQGRWASAVELWRDCLDAEPQGEAAVTAQAGLTHAQAGLRLSQAVDGIRARIGPGGSLHQDGTSLQVVLPAGIASLESIAGQPISSLEVQDGGFTDLTPLAGSQIRSITIQGGAIASLAGPDWSCLGSATLTRTLIRDLSPLRGAPLRRLGMTYCAVDDLSPLCDAQLELLVADHTEISDLGPLRGMPLHHVYIGRTKVASIEPVVSDALTAIDIVDTLVDDLAPLAGRQVRELTMTGTTHLVAQAATLGLRFMQLHRPQPEAVPLLGASGLTMLTIEGWEQADLGLLTGLDLDRLTLAWMEGFDLARLRHVRIRHLRLHGCLVTDLSGLSGLDLHRVSISKCPDADLSTLSGFHQTGEGDYTRD